MPQITLCLVYTCALVYADLSSIRTNAVCVEMAVEIVKINSSDINEVNKFMLENYFTREQMCLKLGIDPERDVSDWICEVTQPILEQNVKVEIKKIKIILILIVSFVYIALQMFCFCFEIF